jgi:hypothetical protein
MAFFNGKSQRTARTRFLAIEPLETRSLLATFASFDGAAAATPYSVRADGVQQGPAQLPGGALPGANANYLRVLHGVPNNFNSVTFNRSDAGAFNWIVADFDFRLTQAHDRPDGLTFALLNTANFGTSGPAPPSGTEPRHAGSLGIGFDSFRHADDPSLNTVELYYRGSSIGQFNIADKFDLAGGHWIHARVVIKDGAISLALTPSGGPTHQVIEEFAIPNYVPFESRVMFSGWSGGADYGAADIDNVNVQYLQAPQSHVSFLPGTIEVNEQAGTVRVTVEREGNTAGVATVGYSLLGHTATAGTDFRARTGTLVFDADETSASFNVPIINDNVRETAETILISLANPSAGTVITGSSRLAIVVNDDEQLRAVGDFKPVNHLPNVMIHAIQLPTGEVLSFDQETGHLHGWLWNPFTRTSRPTAPIPQHDTAEPHEHPPGEEHVEGEACHCHVHLFCSGHTLLPDGRVFFAGGHEGFGESGNTKGVTSVTIYNPYTDTWEHLPAMEHGRWYPTVVMRPNGELVIMGGYDETGTNTINNSLEVYKPQADGTWVRLTVDVSNDLADNRSVNDGYLYPKMFLAPDGRIFVLGGGGRTWWLDTTAAGTANLWTRGPSTLSQISRNDYGTASMLTPTKIVLIGGGGDLEGAVPQRSVEILDLAQANPQWQALDPMPGPGRRQHNATVLPGGEILVTGGTSSTGFNGAAGTQYSALLLRPSAAAGAQWQILDSAQTMRVYHSTALLMPTGEVLTSGSGQPHAENAIDQYNAEVYTPAYLGLPKRPVISSTASSWRYGATHNVWLATKITVSQVVLMRPGSVTHSLEENARRVPLTWKWGANGALQVQTPSNANVAPPGDYMVFVVDNRGVSSAAKWIRLSGASTSTATLRLAPTAPAAPLPVVSASSKQLALLLSTTTTTNQAQRTHAPPQAPAKTRIDSPQPPANQKPAAPPAAPPRPVLKDARGK